MNLYRYISRVTLLTMPVYGSALFFLAGLTACITAQPIPGQSLEPDNSMEGRLQALEAGQQRLAARLDDLQDASRHARTGQHVPDVPFDQLPAEAMPIKPDIVLVTSPERRAPVPMPTVIPAPAHEIVPPAVSNAPHRRPAQDEWVINLASYSKESFAAGKLTEFAAEGVAVEQVQARVKGETVYRLRVPGFETFRAASAEARTIQAVLGLEDTWIARR